MTLLSAFRPPSVRPSIHLRRRKKIVVGTATGPSNEEELPDHSSITPSKHTPRHPHLSSLKQPLRPIRLLRQDLNNLRERWVSDWTIFNQLVVASAVYVFFTNLLPGITFASDLYVGTGASWGTIEVVLSTGLSGVIFALYDNMIDRRFLDWRVVLSRLQVLDPTTDNSWRDWSIHSAC